MDKAPRVSVRLDELSMSGQIDEYELLLNTLNDQDLDAEILRRSQLSSIDSNEVTPGQVVFEMSDMVDWIAG